MYLKKWRAQAPKNEHAPLDKRIGSLQNRVDQIERELQAQRETEARLAEKETERQERERKEKIEEQRRQETRSFNRTLGYGAIGVGATA